MAATGADDERDHVFGRGIGMTVARSTSVEQARHAFLLEPMPPLVSGFRDTAGRAPPPQTKPFQLLTTHTAKARFCFDVTW